MSDRYVTLMGAEQIDRSASRMQAAAEQMSRAVSNLDGVLERHQRFLDDWLQRFEAVLDKPRAGECP